MRLAGRRSTAWIPSVFGKVFDAAVIVTDHEGVDYQELVDSIDLVIDTRNATLAVTKGRERIVMA
jgi:UDP-N-acetyl-D-glucosamine dehydrogenase